MVSWGYYPGIGCAATVVRLLFRDRTTDTVWDTGVRGSSGALWLTPQSSGSYFLQVFVNGWYIDFESEPVTVGLPVVGGRPTAEITQPSQNGLFAQAVGVPNAIVRIAGDVDLDLSYMDDLSVATGVQIIGVRTNYPRGLRLFTTTFPRSLLNVVGDNVRITGIRFDGGESSDPCDSAGDDYPYADAISVVHSLPVEIDHNELFRWRGAGVVVYDNEANRINRGNAATVWVHDNYIHDNQHPTYCGLNPLGSGLGGGYGVSVNRGGFALIERNVFDRNRHAITGHGSEGDGYLLYRNLFLSPGVDDVKLGVTFYNHQIDMHGLQTCGSGEHWNCGLAGEFMDVGWNTVAALNSDAIQLRGTPSDPGGMSVHNNVFMQPRDSALTQTQTGLHDDGGNLFSVFDLVGYPAIQVFRFRPDAAATCDFDGDGTNDFFWATGATWWYLSSLVGHWVFLNQSSRGMLGEHTLSDVNQDGLCDVTIPGEGTFFTPHDNRGLIGTVFHAPPLLPTSWTAVEGGLNHSCAISWSRVSCWGDNSEGQLGDGSRNDTVGPVPVAISTAVNQVVTSRMHSCALESDTPYRLFCWGNNAYGQLGDGTTTPRLVPVLASGDVGWDSVSAGAWHTCGIRADGSLWCWGSNTYGQLGDGTTTQHPQPIRVGIQTGWITVRAGGWHTCATRIDGSLWCWGHNTYGQLGDGTVTDRLVPVRVAGDGWMGLSAGFQHSCATRSDRSLWCWAGTVTVNWATAPP